MLRRLSYLKSMGTMRPRRYRNLLKIIYQRRCRNIMEIGVYRGKHAKQMIEVAKIFYPAGEIYYYGFDLFEKLTEENFVKEQAKQPPSCAYVRQQLEETGTNIRLYTGYTRDTLPSFVAEFQATETALDFIFIDGGHSIETIASDWRFVKDLMSNKTVVLFDDYYGNNEPEVAGFGCQSLINTLDKEAYDVEVLQPSDYFQKEWGLLKTNMVKVELQHTR